MINLLPSRTFKGPIFQNLVNEYVFLNSSNENTDTAPNMVGPIVELERVIEADGARILQQQIKMGHL
jgi:hypothetical protein